MIRALAIRLLIGCLTVTNLAISHRVGAETTFPNDETAASSRLKAIGAAMWAHHKAHDRFPDVAIRDTAGKPLLSWRVAILPYLDGGPELHKQFHLDEPWDSDHNRKLIDEMPDVFRGARTDNGRTRFLAPVGKRLAFTADTGGLNYKSFTDGTSKTIMLVEVDPDRAVVWTKPEDLIVDFENPIRGITDGGIFSTLFVDGSAHDLKGSMDPQILRDLLTRNGREPTAIPKF